MITIKDVSNKTGLTEPGVLYRLKQMEKAGQGIEVKYQRGKVGAIRVYTDKDLQAIINYKARKPGGRETMLEYEISQIIHVLLPYLSNTLSVIAGIVIANMFWKARIHRYAKTEVIETLEYQKNKIEFLESENKRKDTIISELKGFIKIAKMAAIRIVEVVK